MTCDYRNKTNLTAESRDHAKCLKNISPSLYNLLHETPGSPEERKHSHSHLQFRPKYYRKHSHMTSQRSVTVSNFYQSKATTSHCHASWVVMNTSLLLHKFVRIKALMFRCLQERFHIIIHHIIAKTFSKWAEAKLHTPHTPPGFTLRSYFLCTCSLWLNMFLITNR